MTIIFTISNRPYRLYYKSGLRRIIYKMFSIESHGRDPIGLHVADRDDLCSSDYGQRYLSSKVEFAGSFVWNNLLAYIFDGNGPLLAFP